MAVTVYSVTVFSLWLPNVFLQALCLIRGPKCPLPAITSFVREYFDTAVGAGKFVHFVDIIADAAHMTDGIRQNIKLVFQCIDKAGLKLSTDKSSFGQAKIEL